MINDYKIDIEAHISTIFDLLTFFLHFLLGFYTSLIANFLKLFEEPILTWVLCSCFHFATWTL